MANERGATGVATTAGLSAYSSYDHFEVLAMAQRLRAEETARLVGAAGRWLRGGPGKAADQVARGQAPHGEARGEMA